jgi:hypothetical protein
MKRSVLNILSCYRPSLQYEQRLPQSMKYSRAPLEATQTYSIPQDTRIIL